MLQSFGFKEGVPFSPYWEAVQSYKFLKSLLETKIATAIASGDLNKSTMLGCMHAKGTKTGLLPEGREAELLAHEALVIMMTGVLAAALLHISLTPSLDRSHLCQTPQCKTEDPVSHSLDFGDQ